MNSIKIGDTVGVMECGFLVTLGEVVYIREDKACINHAKHGLLVYKLKELRKSPKEKIYYLACFVVTYENNVTDAKVTTDLYDSREEVEDLIADLEVFYGDSLSQAKIFEYVVEI